jgi:hypothetical protein
LIVQLTIWYASRRNPSMSSRLKLDLLVHLTPLSLNRASNSEVMFMVIALEKIEREVNEMSFEKWTRERAEDKRDHDRNLDRES